MSFKYYIQYVESLCLAKTARQSPICEKCMCITYLSRLVYCSCWCTIGSSGRWSSHCPSTWCPEPAPWRSMCWLTERQEKRDFYLHYIYSMTFASCSDTYNMPSLIVKHNLTRCCPFSDNNNKYDSQAPARNTGNSEQSQQQQHRHGHWNNIIQTFTLVVDRYGFFNGRCGYLESRAADGRYIMVIIVFKCYATYSTTADHRLTNKKRLHSYICQLCQNGIHRSTTSLHNNNTNICLMFKGALTLKFETSAGQ